jgi:uncharacterized protein (DUF2062 family)
MINKEVWKQRCKQILAIDAHPGNIAAAFAVGVFISFTPFFGLHTPLAIAIALLFRLNKVAIITGAWVNTPFTVGPVLIASYKLGRLIRGKEIKPFVIKSLEWADLKIYAKSLILGSSLIGFAAALASYAICYWLVVRFRRKDAGLAELTREMEEVGEDLE